MKPLRETVLETLNKLAPNAKKLLVAVSGGPDSVALVRLLETSVYLLELAHFDHALRDTSAEDAEFVKGLADELELPFHSERADVAAIARAKGWNLEDAARRLRYSFLALTAKRIEADYIVTGHTLDDQAETVLMQLSRGAAYLTGMQSVRGQVLRPLLEVPKKDLLEYLRSLKQPYLEDLTNKDISRTRAWLRHEVLSQLEVRYPNIRKTLAELAYLQQEQKSTLQKYGRALIKNNRLKAGRLKKADVAVQRQALAELLKDNYAPVTFENLERILAALEKQSPTRISLNGNLTARIAYGDISIVKILTKGLDEVAVTMAEALPKDVAASVLGRYPNLVYRSRKPGDIITLMGGTKKLSDLLIDKKIPKEERDSIRLLASGERVLWIEDVAVDPSVAQFKANEDETWMRRALELATEAAKKGELPVGAVVIRNAHVIAEAHNETETRRDPTAHAEVLALRRAAKKLGDWRLEACTLYVTLEPCPMCFGALLQAHLPKLVYGASNLREGALGSVSDLRDANWKRGLEVRSGVLEHQCSQLLITLFKARR